MEYPMITIRAARVNAGLTQKQAAKILQIDTRTLQYYETGRYIPRWNIVNMMEKLYGIPVDYLIFGPNSAKTEVKEDVNGQTELAL